MATNTIDLMTASTAVGIAAVQVTGKEADAFKAAGYAAWVKSVTGEPPKVTDVNGRAVLVLTTAQVKSMQEWVKSSLKKPETPPSVSMELGPVFKPFIYQSVIGIALAGALAGFMVGKFVK